MLQRGGPQIPRLASCKKRSTWAQTCVREEKATRQHGTGSHEEPGERAGSDSPSSGPPGSIRASGMVRERIPAGEPSSSWAFVMAALGRKHSHPGQRCTLSVHCLCTLAWGTPDHFRYQGQGWGGQVCCYIPLGETARNIR